MSNSIVCGERINNLLSLVIKYEPISITELCSKIYNESRGSKEGRKYCSTINHDLIILQKNGMINKINSNRRCYYYNATEKAKQIKNIESSEIQKQLSYLMADFKNLQNQVSVISAGLIGLGMNVQAGKSLEKSVEHMGHKFEEFLLSK